VPSDGSRQDRPPRHAVANFCDLYFPNPFLLLRRSLLSPRVGTHGRLLLEGREPCTLKSPVSSSLKIFWKGVGGLPS